MSQPSRGPRASVPSSKSVSIRAADWATRSASFPANAGTHGMTFTSHVPVSEGMPLSSLQPAISPESWGTGEATQALAEVGRGGELYTFEQVFGEPL